MRRVGWRALLAAGMCVGLASAGWAGTGVVLDRSDLLDIDNVLAANKLDDPLTVNFALLRLQESQVSPSVAAGVAFASGSVKGPGTGATSTRIYWQAYEPDQTRRSASSGSLEQKDQVALGVVINDAIVVPLQAVPGCRAKVSARQPKRDALSINRGSWSMTCNKKAVEAIGLDAAELESLQTALGKKVVGKDGVHIQGNCTDANCTTPPS